MASITDNDLFEYLLGGLLEEYSTTCLTLDAQINLEIPEKLFILQKQQDKLANATSTNPIALVANHKPYRRDRQERNLDKAKNSICFLCGGQHRIRDCDLKDDLIEIANNIRERKQKKLRRESKKPLD